MRKPSLCFALILPLALSWACGSSRSDANDPGGEVTGNGGSGAASGGLDLGGDVAVGGDAAGLPQAGAGSSANTNGGGSGGGEVVGTGTTACSNGKDDDGDGLIDGFDPECTGSGDNDEASYATGMPGDNRDGKWQDCFFDGNSGAGEDGCRYATGCLTGDLELDDKDCQLAQNCIDFCAKFVPNGCDCFGCCSVQTAEGETIDVMTTSSCSLDKLADTDACQRCVKSDVCGNTCGRCELCPGKTVADLPDDCGTGTGGSGTGGSGSTGGSTSTGGTGSGGSPTYTCDGGEQVCGAGMPGCPLNYYCSQGCCLPQPPR
jgi:hypothetical protein